MDTTWATTNDPSYYVDLQYFLQTDEERAEDGCDVDEDDLTLVEWFKRDYDKDKYKATDDKYKFLHNHALLRGMDTDRNVITYFTELDNDQEYSYGDL